MVLLSSITMRSWKFSLSSKWVNKIIELPVFMCVEFSCTANCVLNKENELKTGNCVCCSSNVKFGIFTND